MQAEWEGQLQAVQAHLLVVRASSCPKLSLQEANRMTQLASTAASAQVRPTTACRLQSHLCCPGLDSPSASRCDLRQNESACSMSQAAFPSNTEILSASLTQKVFNMSGQLPEQVLSVMLHQTHSIQLACTCKLQGQNALCARPWLRAAATWTMLSRVSVPLPNFSGSLIAKMARRSSKHVFCRLTVTFTCDPGQCLCCQ